MNNVVAPWVLKIVIAAHILVIHAVALSFRNRGNKSEGK